MEKGIFSNKFYGLTSVYYHRLQRVDDFKEVEDQILKFAPTVTVKKTCYYYDIFQKEFKNLVEPTTSGHGSIDLIVPDCHKASGIARLVDCWNILPE